MANSKQKKLIKLKVNQINIKHHQKSIPTNHTSNSGWTTTATKAICKESTSGSVSWARIIAICKYRRVRKKASKSKIIEEANLRKSCIRSTKCLIRRKTYRIIWYGKKNTFQFHREHEASNYKVFQISMKWSFVIKKKKVHKAITIPAFLIKLFNWL